LPFTTYVGHNESDDDDNDSASFSHSVVQEQAMEDANDDDSVSDNSEAQDNWTTTRMIQTVVIVHWKRILTLVTIKPSP
jgi:hypothetical protein